MRKAYILLLFFISALGFSQEYAYIDFGEQGGQETSGNWNNVTSSTNNEAGITVNLINENGGSTGITLTVDDPFDLVNTAGTDSPDSSLPFSASATSDSFFGETVPFNSNTQPTGGFALSGLNVNKYYSFVIFASRMGGEAGESRQTLYNIAGSTTESASLEVANNTDTTAQILNIQPNSNGQITFRAQPGTRNDNSFEFYYLGAIQLIASDSPITISAPNAALSLVYPNGGNILEVGKTQRITWESTSINNTIDVEFSSNNGISWSDIATVSADLEYYDFTVPNQISDSCLIRISGEGISDTSSNTFSVIANEGEVYRIVVLGSSTAEGVGPQDPNDSWVNLYRDFLTQQDSRFEIINLAKGGYTTYDILPTGTPIKDGVDRTVDTERNVNKALSLDPGGIIINMPSNDAANGYPAEDQLNNYDLISNMIADQNVPLWVTSVQPKDFGSNTINKNIQLEMLDAVQDKFGDMTIDFWTGLGQSDNNGILPQYDSGDGTHMNADGHRILFARVKNEGVGVRVKNDANGLSIRDKTIAKSTFTVYPNPVTERCTIQLAEAIDTNASITVYDLLGKTVYSANTEIIGGKTTWSKGSIKAGLYILQVAYDKKINAQRLLIH
ncbi:MAG TPA: T9SS type A sorting domain-containing protein [Leeuwenhoekiella sp.]|nr:T9SS type A sorting domain-containing protein [Leeuwenhoekiella sp.]